jgi:hypothetical protein
MRRALVLFVATIALAAVVVSSGLASATRPSGAAALVIQHQLEGCHAWSLNDGPALTSQTVRLVKGGSLLVTDNDVMSHQLLKLTGPTVTMQLLSAGAANTGKLTPPYAIGLMPHMGALLKVTFTKSGTYTFTTKEGDDYFPGINTVGPDNILKAKVVVG